MQPLLFLAKIPNISEEGQGIPSESCPDSWIPLESELPVCCSFVFKPLNVGVVSHAVTATEIKFLAMRGFKEFLKHYRLLVLALVAS